MLILSSPSGAGKSSITRALIQENSNARLSISATTRPQRPGEVNGVDYHFFTQEKFDQLVAQNSFIEHATVFGNQYGTLVSEVDHYLKQGIDVIFDVDWQGAQNLRKKKTTNLVSIYILPPSISELKNRLAGRRQDSAEVIEGRMREAMREISHYNEYDYVIVNDNFADALLTVQGIIRAESSKISRLDSLDNFIRSF